MVRLLAVLLVGAAAAGGCTSSIEDVTPGSSSVNASQPPATTVLHLDTICPTTTPTPPSTMSAPVPTPAAPNALRVTIAGGCPSSVAGLPPNEGPAHDFVTNPDDKGLTDGYVPGRPTEALICRYWALDVPGAGAVPSSSAELPSGALYSATRLDADKAGELTRTLNDIKPTDFTTGCMPELDQPRYTAIVFAVPGRSDVDLWLEDSNGCPGVTNGRTTSGELVNGIVGEFLRALDHAAPPAPQQFLG